MKRFGRKGSVALAHAVTRRMQGRTMRCAHLLSTLGMGFLLLSAALLLASCQGSGPEPSPVGSFTERDELSSQQLSAFAEDSRGYIWIATQRGVNRFNGHSYLQFDLPTDTLSWKSNNVVSLAADDRGNLWIGTLYGLCLHRYGEGIRRIGNVAATLICDTPGDWLIYGNPYGIWKLDKQTLTATLCHTFERLDYTNTFLTDRSGRLWAFSGHDVTCIDPVSGQVETELSTQGRISSALLMGTLIYIATNAGLEIVSTVSHQWQTTAECRALSDLLRTETAHKLFAYSSSALLVYTNRRQLYLYNTATRQLLPSQHPDFPFEVPQDEIISIFTDSHRNVWIGTADNGYKVIYNRQQAFNLNYRLTTFFQGRRISSLHMSAEGDLWIVSDGKDLYRYGSDRQITLIDCPHDGSLGQVWTDAAGQLWLIGLQEVYCGQVRGRTFIRSATYPFIPLEGAADKAGRVYVSAIQGTVYRKEARDTQFEPIALPGVEHSIVRFLELTDGRMALLDMNAGVYLLDPVSLEVELIDVPARLGRAVMLSDICQDSGDRLWVASLGEGVMCLNLRTGEFQHFPPDNYCRDAGSVMEDALGYIWIGTYEGLARLDRYSGRVTNYYREDGVTDIEFSLGCVERTPHKWLVFGGIGGLTSVSPESLAPNPETRLLMEHLSVGGQAVQDLTLQPEVSLPHDNATIDLSFTTLNYGISQPVCQYRMEGLETAWTTVRTNHHASYPHLPVGHYTFRLRATGGSTGEVERSIPITVRPPVWSSPVMLWLVYPLAFVCLLAAIGYILLHRYRSRQRLKAIMQEREQEHRANELNMRFFSNISHEFRTPLTLIHGALAMLPAGGAHDRLLSIMRRNTERMLRLVGQLMDFNKMEDGMLRLSVCPTDACSLVERMADLFEARIKQRGMQFRLDLPPQPVIAWLDVDKVEKVLVNLVSNAIKYSDPGDSLTIRLGVEDADGGKQLRLDVADTGHGVPDGQREAIFQRFYQVEKQGRMPALGTGIGLYYVRSLVELHHGQIACLPGVPKGSVFSLTLPLEEEAYTDREKQVTGPAVVVHQDLDLPGDAGHDRTSRPTATADATEAPRHAATPEGTDSSVADGTAPVADGTAPLLMLVDDDPDVISLLQMLLAPHYRTVAYANASAAYADIETVCPDLILSDVIMEEVDGYTFCRKVRDNAATCHIPVVLLTAKSALAEKIEGLDCGASAYITKPFEPDYLLAVLRSQLQAMHRLQQRLTNATRLPADATPLEGEAAMQEADAALMQTLYAYIEAHLSDSELNLDELTVQLGMSERKFFYKMKALVGDTPGAFFRTYKLNRAAQMLLETDEKLAWIADATGFSNPSHFSSSFRKRFGCSPSEYKARRGAKP